MTEFDTEYKSDTEAKEKNDSDTLFPTGFSPTKGGSDIDMKSADITLDLVDSDSDSADLTF